MTNGSLSLLRAAIALTVIGSCTAAVLLGKIDSAAYMGIMGAIVGAVLGVSAAASGANGAAKAVHHAVHEAADDLHK